MNAVRLITEGYDGEIVSPESAWPEIYSAFQNRKILQVEGKGVKTYVVEGKEIPCLQVQIGNVVGIVPAQETGVRDIPENVDEIAGLSLTEKREIIRRIERRLVGLPVWILVCGVEKENKRFIASRRLALEIMAPRAWERIEEGAVLPGTVRELYRRRAVLDLGGVEAVMKAQEMSWGFVDDARDVLELGKTYNIKVVKADRESGVVEVSLRQAQPSPWSDCAERYEKGGVYSGVVSGVIDRGVFVNLEPGVDVFAHHPKFTPVKKGDRVKVYLVKVDVERQRIFGRIRG